MRQRADLSATPPPAPQPPAAWLDLTLPTVEENLALDEALLELAHEGLTTSPCVRTWMAPEPTVVLGSSCRVGDEVDGAACAAAGVRIMRRPSGGGTVLLGPGCLMWSVITPHPGGTPAIETIHAAMLEPLAAAINLAASPPAMPSGWRVARRGTSDLAVSTPFDATERKVSGNALRVRRNGVLYHGTLLDHFDLSLVEKVLKHPPREPEYRSQRPHAAFLANLALGRERLERAVRAAFNATLVPDHWPRDRVARLVGERYGTRAWTHRL